MEFVFGKSGFFVVSEAVELFVVLLACHWACIVNSGGPFCFSRLDSFTLPVVCSVSFVFPCFETGNVIS